MASRSTGFSGFGWSSAPECNTCWRKTCSGSRSPVLSYCRSFISLSHPSAGVGDLIKGSAGRVNILLLIVGSLALKFRTTLLNRIDRRFFREAYRQDQIFVKLSEAIARAASVEEVSRLLCSEIQAALHPRVIFSVSRASREEFTLLYSDSAEAGGRPFLDFPFAPSEFERSRKRR